MFTPQDSQWMAQALRLAERGLYGTSPNPRVGCVLVRAGDVVGSGWHRRAGEPHAEVHALREAGEAARGATAYVTLEPCSHHGRTPPCAEALIEAGVARVVVAVQDPNPQVAGEGIARLRAAGIAVESGLMETEARELNVGFFARMERGTLCRMTGFSAGFFLPPRSSRMFTRGTLIWRSMRSSIGKISGWKA